MKYKIGDTVRVKQDEELLEEVTLELGDFKDWFEGTITGLPLDEDDTYYVVSTRNNWDWNLLEDSLELVDDDEKKTEDSPSLDYKSEYHRLLEELEELRLVNKILIEHIKRGA